MPAWAIEWKERPGFLGQCALNPPQQFGATELSWRLVRASWGQGVASEAVSAMLRHAVDELQIGPVVALIHPDNKASRRVAEKVGLRLPAKSPLSRKSASWCIERPSNEHSIIPSAARDL